MPDPIQEVLVVGGGSAGFISAFTLKAMLPDLRVSLVRSTKVPVIGVGESTTPLVPRHFHDYLGIDRTTFFKEVGPSWKLGIRFEWGSANETHFNYPFDHNLNEWHAPLPWIDAYYCLAGLKDQSIRAAMMDQQRSPIVRHQGQYQVDPGAAYHLENRALIAFLEKQATKFGVELIEGEVVGVEHCESGDIDAVQLDDGRRLAADLFVDCSGFRSLILEKALHENYVSYQDSLFCDAAIVGSFPREGPVRPYTTAETMEHGWCWRIEFEDHITRGYVFSSNFCSEEEAMREMKEKNPELGDDLRTVRFRSGRYENFWTKNVVAIGNSSGFVEPLEATALHLIVVQLQYLVQALKDCNRRIVAPMRKLQNARYRDIWDDTRDFLAIHYRFNRRSNSEFWQHCREHTDLAGAADLAELYREAGPTRRIETMLPANSIFGYTGYVTLLMGQSVETAFELQMSDSERAKWESIQQHYCTVASMALPVREALELVRSPQWQWPKMGR